MTATKTFHEIQEFANAQLTEDQLVAIPEDLPIGQLVAQGDINILRVGEIPKGMIPAKRVAQLAPGTTRGSRHCIKANDLDHCDFYQWSDPNELEGPCIVFNDTTTIEHPEHKHHIYPAGWIVVIGYQRSHAEEVRRAQD